MALTLNEYIKMSYKRPNKAVLRGLGASEELIEYLCETPENTNPAVLKKWGIGIEDSDEEELVFKTVIVHSGNSDAMFESDSDIKTISELTNIVINKNRPDLLTVKYRYNGNDTVLEYGYGYGDTHFWNGYGNSMSFALIISPDGSVRAEDFPD